MEGNFGSAVFVSQQRCSACSSCRSKHKHISSQCSNSPIGRLDCNDCDPQRNSHENSSSSNCSHDATDITCPCDESSSGCITTSNHNDSTNAYKQTEMAFGLYLLHRRTLVQLPVCFYHPDCFVCKRCKAKLDMNSYRVSGGELYCEGPCENDKPPHYVNATKKSTVLRFVQLTSENSGKKMNVCPQCELYHTSTDEIGTEDEMEAKNCNKYCSACKSVSAGGQSCPPSHCVDPFERRLGRKGLNATHLPNFVSMKTIQVHGVFISPETTKLSKSHMVQLILLPKCQSKVTNTLLWTTNSSSVSEDRSLATNKVVKHSNREVFAEKLQEQASKEPSAGIHTAVHQPQSSALVTERKLLIQYQCWQCHDTVNPSEMCRYSSYVYHPTCVKCCICQDSPGSQQELLQCNGSLYCGLHYRESMKQDLQSKAPSYKMHSAVRFSEEDSTADIEEITPSLGDQLHSDLHAVNSRSGFIRTLSLPRRGILRNSIQQNVERRT